MTAISRPDQFIAPGAPYLERAWPKTSRIDDALAALSARTETRFLSRWRIHRLGQLADAVDARASAIEAMSDDALRDAADTLRAYLLRDGISPEHAATGFALVREASRRCLGLRHHRVQLIGGAAMLGGALAEMEAGEGKTITAMLPAVMFALASRPVHVVTVNDYLARRDAAQLRPVYAALGLSVGLVVQGQEADERRAAYGCDITYCTNKDLVFDYLRDRLALGPRRARTRLLVDELLTPRSTRGPLLLRGLHVAIVDEADSVLIDEARTPLIISGADGKADDAELYQAALELARGLTIGEDFTVLLDERSLQLTPYGRERLAEMTVGWDGLWAARRAREELVEQALNALQFYQRDVHYVIVDGKVQIVDEYTGRVMADRSWERGLHQMIEAKEGCEVTGQRHTLSRITYQRFFRRYGHLCGMTGTAAEAAGELRAVYGLRVVRVPTHNKLRRQNTGSVVFTHANAKWAAIAARARDVASCGRAVLVGTRSVGASEHLADLLTVAGLRPVVLNALQDQEEAEIIAQAGEPGRITVATNMAGRGTDILISPAVRESSGLHVILTEYHESTRIDRQLFGRGGRHGEPGSYEAIVAIEDELFARFAGRVWQRLAGPFADRQTGLLPGWIGQLLRRSAQRNAERRNAEIRRATQRADERLETVLAFSGRGE